MERFTTDRNLGRLTKWLRILGYDTRYERGEADRPFLRRAIEEGRIVLTRKRDLVNADRDVTVLLIVSDQWRDQLVEVLQALVLTPDPDRLMTRCLNCNELLEEVSGSSVEGLVPSYVWQRYDRFRRCGGCRRIYWPGTHRHRIEEVLRRRSPSDRP